MVFTDLVGSVDLKGRIGTPAYLKLIGRHDEIVRGLVEGVAEATLHKDTGDGFMVTFARASDAVIFSLRFQEAIRSEAWEPLAVQVRVGIHLGQVAAGEVEETGKPKVVGLAADMAARVMGLAEPGQILISQPVFHEANQYVREHPQSGAGAGVPQLRWEEHGEYRFKGARRPVMVYEVGASPGAPFAAPAGGDKAVRVEGKLQRRNERLTVRTAVLMMVAATIAWGIASIPSISDPVSIVVQRLAQSGSHWVVEELPFTESWISSERVLKSMDHVALVLEKDATVKRLNEAGKHDLATDDKMTLRKRDAQVIRALSKHGVRAVVLDYEFGESGDTHELADACAELTRQGAGLVLATKDWSGADGVNRDIAAFPHRFGQADIGKDGELPQVVLFQDPPPLPTHNWRPGLALAAFMAALQPDALGRDRLEWSDMTTGDAIVRMDRPALGGGRRVTPRLLEFAGSPINASPVAALGFALPGKGVLEAAELDYADLLVGDCEDKLERLRGRVVVLGSPGTDGKYQPPHQGAPVPGVLVHALAIELLLRNSGFAEGGVVFVLTASVACAFVGWWATGTSRKQRVVRVLLALTLSMFTVCVLFLGFALYLSPLGIVLGTVLGGVARVVDGGFVGVDVRTSHQE